MPRVSFSMATDPRAGTVLEHRHGPERAELLQRVTEASYRGAVPAPFWRRWLGAGDRVELRPPFDTAGNDVHALWAAPAPPLDDHDDPLGSVRMASGTVTALLPREPDDEVVLRDAWLPDLRITSSIHFGLTTSDGAPPVAVAFAMSPLVVATPRQAPLSEALSWLSPRERSVCERALGLHERRAFPAQPVGERLAQVVELKVGDVIDVLGMASRPEEIAGRFDLSGRYGSYRDAPSELVLVIGDRPGLRMVLRKR